MKPRSCTYLFEGSCATSAVARETAGFLRNFFRRDGLTFNFDALLVVPPILGGRNSQVCKAPWDAGSWDSMPPFHRGAQKP
ncbi:hypothetical protein HPB48_011788 [Haemaphysalis longicornis]|uniref:Uncharacterized protein n=1 Tax=Haemaphysalis longicornis TaxID=44386 RepID=A0A9J6G6M6_HAELO|nr:hypothetical protein HPB48_011788 [Haemaphysalis longicornis]